MNREQMLEEALREGFVSWLSGAFPQSWPRWQAELAWQNRHVAALAWQEQAARAALTPQPATSEERADLLAFLNGAAPLDGVWFGGAHPTERGQFWWRKRLAALAQPAAPVEDDAAGPLAEGWQLSIADGHSGRGVYAHMTDYPDEGAVFLLAAPVAVPEGYVLVPVEPTPGMLLARPKHGLAGSRRHLWAAMLAATPPTEQPAAGEVVAPVLVRDLAEIIGSDVPTVCRALTALGRPERSTNMAVGGEESLAVAKLLATQPAEPSDAELDALMPLPDVNGARVWSENAMRRAMRAALAKFGGGR